MPPTTKLLQLRLAALRDEKGKFDGLVRVKIQLRFNLLLLLLLLAVMVVSDRR